ncbi:MAG: M15 family peptidase [Myxococcales bacterium]|nr:MAG: M15 family peptidase [Myxococcales bacterium]
MAAQVALTATPAAAVTHAAVIAPPSAPTPSIEPTSHCNEQAPQSFLMDAHFDSFFAAGGSAREWKRVLEKAVRYRTQEYGYVKGFGDKAWNASTPSDQASVVTFFGVPVSIHRRVAPALSCVETAIRARCADEAYQPYVLSGLRKRNTYVNGEASNHVYGIAIDVDPTRNPCCGCIGEWHDSERCRNDKSKFERMDMPRCWVTEFERFGFYWLGHGKIEDTMHFEFLADPSQIVRRADVLR